MPQITEFSNSNWAVFRGAGHFSDTVTDLLSDIGHLCDAKEIDFLELLAKAIGDWKLEQKDPESIGKRAKVTIEVET